MTFWRIKKFCWSAFHGSGHSLGIDHHDLVTLASRIVFVLRPLRLATTLIQNQVSWVCAAVYKRLSIYFIRSIFPLLFQLRESSSAFFWCNETASRNARSSNSRGRLSLSSNNRAPTKQPKEGKKLGGGYRNGLANPRLKRNWKKYGRMM